MLKKAKSEALANLNSAFDMARDSMKALREAAEDALKPPEGSDTAQLLKEMQMQAAWGRYKPLLDKGHDPAQVIDAAGDDPVALEALRREIPAYLRATHNGNRQEYDRDLEAVHMVLDRAGDPHLNALQRRAKEILAELDAGESSWNWPAAPPTGPWTIPSLLRLSLNGRGTFAVLR